MAFLTGALALSCTLPVNQDQTSILTLHLSGLAPESSRTILPGNVTPATYSATLTSALYSSRSSGPITGSIHTFFDVPPGAWTLVVEGRDGSGGLVGRSAEIPVLKQPGDQSLTVEVSPVMGEGNGGLSVTYRWPDASVLSYAFEVRKLSDDSLVEIGDLPGKTMTEGTASVTIDIAELPSDTYTTLLTLHTLAGQTFLWPEDARVFSGLTSQKTTAFDAETIRDYQDIPLRPASLTAVANGSAAIDLSWTFREVSGSAHKQALTIYRRADGGDSSVIAEFSAQSSTSSFTDTVEGLAFPVVYSARTQLNGNESDAQDTTVYKISYAMNGGTNAVENLSYYTLQSLPIVLHAPVRAGYVFAGWFDNLEFSGNVFSEIADGTLENRAFWAKWEAIEYPITYHLNEGTNNPGNPVFYTVSGTPLMFSSPTKAGYGFAAWYANENFEGEAVTGLAEGTTGPVELWARWMPSQPISYELNGGTNHPENLASYTELSPTIVLQAPSRSGFEFGGWYDNVDLSGTVVTELPQGSTGSKTFWAKWSVLVYAITYRLNDGTNHASNPESYTVESLLLLLYAPVKTNYTFNGWYATGDYSGSAITNIPQGSTGDKEFWAKWTPVNYSITYNLNNGTNHASNPSSYTVETPTIMLQEPGRTGYEFGGWFDNSGLSGTAITSIPQGSTGNKAFWAKWLVVSYTITYYLDGGTNHISNPNTYTVAQSVTLQAPTKQGFGGAWYDNSLFEGAAITAIPLGSTGNRELWVKWTAYELGGTGPGGGVIFYDKGSYSSGWRFFEAHLTDSLKTVWKTTQTASPTTYQELGKGKDNTFALYLNHGSGNYYWAAQQAFHANINGFSDWFLPSYEELQELYNARHLVPGLKAESYWSSYSGGLGFAAGVNFATGSGFSTTVTNQNWTRIIRRF
jgi:uncharacterized repeat protein (TIGR02543 family)